MKRFEFTENPKRVRSLLDLITLLESHIKVCNMPLFYDHKNHQIIAFRMILNKKIVV